MLEGIYSIKKHKKDELEYIILFNYLHIKILYYILGMARCGECAGTRGAVRTLITGTWLSNLLVAIKCNLWDINRVQGHDKNSLV